jgi:hypothetical protein
MGRPPARARTAANQLFAGGTFPTGPTRLVVDAKYNVGNPASVLIAGNCDGGPIGLVDDGLTVSVDNPSPKGGGTLHRNFFNLCGGVRRLAALTACSRGGALASPRHSCSAPGRRYTGAPRNTGRPQRGL